MNSAETVLLCNKESFIHDELIKNLLLLYPLAVSEVCRIRMDDIDVSTGALRIRKRLKPDSYIDINEETRQLLSDKVKFSPSDQVYLFSKDNVSRYSMKDLLLVAYTFPWEDMVQDPKYDKRIKYPGSRETIVRKFIAIKCFRISGLISNSFRHYLLELLLNFLPKDNNFTLINNSYVSEWLTTINTNNRWTVLMIKKFFNFLQETKLIKLEINHCFNYPTPTRQRYKFYLKGKH
ncbi:hypothetical protein ACPUYX_11375 [Desulfosporosinus sp. SYSU MS00001]|uniref:hypothetical protein n=1 Tax=Desulfosporosinus sp. SYSU MS00001 TaxID=3416284 RepID=UPI003CF23C4D